MTNMTKIDSIEPIIQHHPIKQFIMMQMKLYQQYPEKWIVKDGQANHYERGTWTENGELLEGIAILLNQNEIEFHIVNRKNNMYPDVTYTYQKVNAKDTDRYFCTGVLNTKYSRVDSNGNREEYTESSYLYGNGCEYGRIIYGNQYYDMISLKGKYVIREQSNGANTEYYMYKLSKKEIFVRKLGNQSLPYPTEPIDEETLKAINHEMGGKQKRR